MANSIKYGILRLRHRGVIDFMEVKFIRALVTLGVPGVALGIFYLLLRSFNFQFSQIGPASTAGIAIIFLLIVGMITFYALHLWAPAQDPPPHNNKSGADKRDEPDTMVLKTREETVTLTELMRSVSHDVVKIAAHTHDLGVMAEYEWVRRRYPDSNVEMQSLVSYKFPRRAEKSKQKEIYFDRLKIKLADSRNKEVYFDISSFFGGGASSLIDPDAFIAKKLEQLYSK